MKFRLIILTALSCITAILSLSACSDSESNSESGNKNPSVIACVGDSITYGYGVSENESYPACLSELFGEDTSVLDYGVNGATGTDGCSMSYSSMNAYSLAKESKADIYIVMFGTNDAHEGFWNKENYLSSIKNMLDEFKSSNPDTKIILMQPPAVFTNGISDDIIKGELHETVSELAEKYKATLIDLYSLTEGNEAFFSDGVHPTADGYREIAECIYEEITEQ